MRRISKLNWSSFLIPIIICSLISIFYYYFRNIHWRTFWCVLESLTMGTINYGSAHLGVFVLTSSLVGLTLVLMAVSNKGIRLKQLGLFKFIICSYIFSTFFSSFKLILNANYKTNFCSIGFKLNEIGHLSFVFLILGIFSFVVWMALNLEEENLKDRIRISKKKKIKLEAEK